MNMDMEMVVRMELRPCLVTMKSTIANALFHTWHDGNAVVELKNGNIINVDSECIKFLDSDIHFEEYAFE